MVSCMERFDVKALREKYGLSQLQLAERLGLTERSVRRWEIEQINPAPNAVRQLERVKRELKQARADEKASQQRQLEQHLGSGSGNGNGDGNGPRRLPASLPNDTDESPSIAAVLPSFER